MNCALLTCEKLRAAQGSGDDAVLSSVLRGLGIRTDSVVWNDPVDWGRYECAVIRSTWDYTAHLDLFLDVLGAVERSGCRLLNPLSVVQWNCRKTYLARFEEQGVPIVPTRVIGPATSELDLIIQEIAQQNGGGGVVLKPVVGAGSHDTFFLPSATSAQIQELLSGEFLIQPLIRSIEEGEFSLVFFNGKYSHGVIKRPKSGDFRSQQEFGAEQAPYHPSAEDLEFCQKVMNVVNQELLYARVDFVRGDGSKGSGPMLMELELIEPTLFFWADSRAPQRFGQALLGRLT